MLSIPLSLHTTQNTERGANGKHRTRQTSAARVERDNVQFRTNLLLISSESVRNGNFRQENSPYAFYTSWERAQYVNFEFGQTLRQLTHSKLHVEFMKKSYPVSRMQWTRWHFTSSKLILHANRFLIAAPLIYTFSSHLIFTMHSTDRDLVPL